MGPEVVRSVNSHFLDNELSFFRQPAVIAHKDLFFFLFFLFCSAQMWEGMWVQTEKAEIAEQYQNQMADDFSAFSPEATPPATTAACPSAAQARETPCNARCSC